MPGSPRLAQGGRGRRPADAERETLDAAEAARRRRRLPADAEREILDAAEAALAERPFRDLTVEDLTRPTGMRRSSFYHYFRSLDEVVVGLLGRVQAEMMDAARPWIEGDQHADPVGSIRRGIADIAAIYARHGPVLGAIHDASFQYESVRQAFREDMLGEWMQAVAAQLRSQRDRKLTCVEDPDELARALILMNTGVFVERLATKTPATPESVAATLSAIWIAAIYPEASSERWGGALRVHGTNRKRHGRGVGTS